MGKSVIVKNYLNVFEERVAHGTITPGHLVALRTDGKVQAATEDAAAILPMFALEDELQGKAIGDNYAADDKVQCWTPQRGEVVNAILKEAQNVTVGTYLVSNGDGTLKAYAVPKVDGESGFADETEIHDRVIVGQALEAVHAETADARIKVKIV